MAEMAENCEDKVDELDEEEQKRQANEKLEAEQLGKEASVKAENKLRIKRENQEAHLHRPRSEDLRKLDSSVKKNSAFVRKLRALTEQQRAGLTSDLKGLNLTKYIQETAISIAEAKLKLADVGCAVSLSSQLHQRYDEFSSFLFDQLQKIYSSKIGKDDDKTVIASKYRIGMRLLGELVLVGVVDEDLGLSLLEDMLNNVIKADSDGHPYLGVIVSFARHCVEDLAGIIPRKQRLLLTKYGVEPVTSQLISVSRQTEFREVFGKYFSGVRDHLVREHKAMNHREKRNRDMLMSKGEITEERKQDNETAQKAYDKLLTNTSTLAEVLDEDMPDLPEYKAPEDSMISIELQLPTGAEGAEYDSNSLWEDEDARSFYEDITDITPFVPAILFEGKKKKGQSSNTDNQEAKPADSIEASEAGTEEGKVDDEPKDDQDEAEMLEKLIQDTEAMALEEMTDPILLQTEDEATAADQPSANALLDDFLSRLPRLMNRKFVDEFAVEFCMSMNTKANRRKLSTALFRVEKNRMDLVPFYARLAATLHPCLDDIVPLLLDTLIKTLKCQVFKKEQDRIESKLKNVRFIAELTKFGMCPKIEAMKCMTILLYDFTHHNLEMACLLMEHCGRFLLRSPESHLRAKALLQIMIRKKQVQHLDPRQVKLVENALYYANPPDNKIVHEKPPPMLAYIRKILYKDLTRVNTEKILRQVRKLPWAEPEVYQWVVTGLTQIWNVKFNNIHCMANLLAGLKTYQEEACVRIVDGVLEDIRVGLELNIPKLNQRRVSTLKFLGELYNYQLIESNVIFRTLYMLLSFGANPDGSPSLLDPHESYFRVRLICMLLDTCGVYFDRGRSKKKLDNFLVFFQCYLFSKRQPLPLEVEHLVLDCIDLLRPDLHMYKTPQEAFEAASALEAKFKDKIGHSVADDLEEEVDDEEEDRSRAPVVVDHEEEDSEVVYEELEDAADDEEGSKMFEDETEMTEGPKLISCHEDEDFKSTLDKLLSDEVSMLAKSSSTEAAIPLHLKGAGLRQPNAINDGKMTFKLMSRRGNKQQVKNLDVPVDSVLAAGIMENRAAMKVEHKQMKELVLNYERRQEEEAFQALISDTASKFPVKFKTVAKKQPDNVGNRPSPTMAPKTTTNSHREYKDQPRSTGEYKPRGEHQPRSTGEYKPRGEHRHRGDGRGRGRGRGRGGGQRNYQDPKRREQDGY